MVTRQTKFERALQLAKEVFDDIDHEAIEFPELPAKLESTLDIIREAASVIAYFDMRAKFQKEICRGCNQPFAFSYYTTAVKHCSITCIDKTLRSMGLKWDPNAPPERRWGRYQPAVVPAVVYEIAQEWAPPSIEEKPKPVSSEAASLIADLDALI